MFVLSIIPTGNPPTVSIQTNPDRPDDELVSPANAGTTDTTGYGNWAVWEAANIESGTRWDVRRLNDTAIQYERNETLGTKDIASTSFSTPAHRNDFELFLLLPLTV